MCCFVSFTRPAPLLKDVNLSESKARELYLECIQQVRRIYQKAKLVHADLSEFNMLWVDSTLKTWGVFHTAVRKVTHDFTNDLYMKPDRMPKVFSDIFNNLN